MTPTEIQEYLHSHIPLSRAMGVGVEIADGTRVRLSAPLAPNINHRETVFGGSASAVAILAAWTLLYLRLKAENISSRLVIQANTMSYDAPITGDFFAEAAFDDAAAWDRFVKVMNRRKRARISVTSVLICSGQKVAGFAGDFVALAIN